MFGERGTITRESTAGKAFLSGLEQLRNDKQNGARVLATNALECLSAMATAMEPLNRTDLSIAAYHLVYTGRPSMNAAIGSAILSALQQLSRLTESTFTRSRVVGILDRCIATRKDASREISSNFTAFVNDLCQNAQRVDILTLSSSSTICNAILHLHENNPDLHLHLNILESRPVCEGVSMAAEILKSARAISAESRLYIQLAPDSHIAQVARMPAPSILVLGADRISPSGHVSNKTGSTAAAVVAKAISPKTQVVVLSETDKIAKPSDFSVYEKGEEDVNREMQEHSPEANDPGEVTRVWAAAGVDEASTSILTRGEGDGVPVKVQNLYFEWVPSKFIDHYICEDGALHRDTIKRISMTKARLEEEMFAGLYDD
jgi:translation initiation factor 2B subunit (eIF-2B alpha/beta/delta family)